MGICLLVRAAAAAGGVAEVAGLASVAFFVFAHVGVSVAGGESTGLRGLAAVVSCLCAHHDVVAPASYQRASHAVGGPRGVAGPVLNLWATGSCAFGGDGGVNDVGNVLWASRRQRTRPHGWCSMAARGRQCRRGGAGDGGCRRRRRAGSRRRRAGGDGSVAAAQWQGGPWCWWGGARCLHCPLPSVHLLHLLHLMLLLLLPSL